MLNVYTGLITFLVIGNFEDQLKKLIVPDVSLKFESILGVVFFKRMFENWKFGTYLSRQFKILQTHIAENV